MSEELKPGERELLKYLAEQPPASAGTPQVKWPTDIRNRAGLYMLKHGVKMGVAVDPGDVQDLVEGFAKQELASASQTAGPSGEAGARARFIDPAKCDHELTRCDTFATCEICGIETYTPPYLTAHQKDLAACQKGETKPQAGPAAFTSISGEPK